ncbi:hypothetical protein MRX96_027804 [Rhipicephalus microplus]
MMMAIINNDAGKDRHLATTDGCQPGWRDAARGAAHQAMLLSETFQDQRQSEDAGRLAAATAQATAESSGCGYKRLAGLAPSSPDHGCLNIATADRQEASGAGKSEETPPKLVHQRR